MPTLEITIVEFDMSKLEDFARRHETTTDKALGDVAFQTMGIAKTLAPVDTGALKNSIDVKHLALNEWMVHDGVHYGIFWEFGFHPWGRGWLHQKPMLRPALRQAVEQKLYDAVKGWFHKDFGV